MNLHDYQALPYEREWFMREEGGQRYYVVRLKDIPAVAGDGATRDEAAEDLREAFDEFVLAWAEAGQDVPLPSRSFTSPSSTPSRPVREWPSAVLAAPTEPIQSPSWADNAELLSSFVFVEESIRAASLESREAVAVA